jgi:shikimate kinase
VPLVIALIGMPGGGKSTVGRHLGRRLGVSFADSDAAIESRVGRSVREYFEAFGEERFREEEASVIADLLRATSGVVATGGGVVLKEENRKLLRDRSVCVYLRSQPEDLFRRLRHDTKRPLLQVSDPLVRLRQLFNERDPLYRETAHFTIETGRPSVVTLVNMVLMQLELAGAIDPGDAASPVDGDS